MTYLPKIGYQPKIKYSVYHVQNVFVRLDKINGLTDNVHIIELTKQIKDILLNKQQNDI